MRLDEDLLSWSKRWRKYLAGQIELLDSGVIATRTGTQDTSKETLAFFRTKLRELDTLIAREEMKG